MTQLKGNIAYTLEFDDKTFNVKLEETNELQGIANTIASASFMRIIGEQTIEFMKMVKKNDRETYNRDHKKSYHEATRLVNELRTICDGTMSDLVEYLKINPLPESEPSSNVTTIQNEITDK